MQISNRPTVSIVEIPHQNLQTKFIDDDATKVQTALLMSNSSQWPDLWNESLPLDDDPTVEYFFLIMGILAALGVFLVFVVACFALGYFSA